MVLLADIAVLAIKHPVIQGLSIEQLSLFFEIGCRILPEVQANARTLPPGNPPPLLNSKQLQLFKSSLAISDIDLRNCWTILYDMICTDVGTLLKDTNYCPGLQPAFDGSLFMAHDVGM